MAASLKNQVVVSPYTEMGKAYDALDEVDSWLGCQLVNQQVLPAALGLDESSGLYFQIKPRDKSLMSRTITIPAGKQDVVADFYSKKLELQNQQNKVDRGEMSSDKVRLDMAFKCLSQAELKAPLLLVKISRGEIEPAFSDKGDVFYTQMTDIEEAEASLYPFVQDIRGHFKPQPKECILASSLPFNMYNQKGMLCDERPLRKKSNPRINYG
ncbi:hypothetical protein [Parendozoicomonas haliclonae]|uniref:Uncharacterized protein n=1 Tax=Parendozoicomonas haliclonae TaxID=1960125 RepID=A0A1X7AL47_9GAMM|nr:hypothetical protein [Parendozoicomonas haliclonae]SMA47714.1 hypothetical protein EHSB41UT_02521 [Parendozoicomonas haliclonae]